VRQIANRSFDRRHKVFFAYLLNRGDKTTAGTVALIKSVLGESLVARNIGEDEDVTLPHRLGKRKKGRGTNPNLNLYLITAP